MAVFFKLAASPFISAACYCGRKRVSESETVHKLGQSFHIFEEFLQLKHYIQNRKSKSGLK